MRDFPVFTTEYGVASLILKEIPYQGTAYVIIRDTLEPEKLIGECVSFCSVCGAEKIYATGHRMLESRPLYTAMWEMRCPVEALGDTDAVILPVREETLDTWREIYNKKVRQVPNGAWMTQADGKEMLQKGDGYFVYRDGTLLGIGRASGAAIDWVASVRQNAGTDVVCALARTLTEQTANLTVASENAKALGLYEKLGFVKTKELSRWYQVK